MTSSLAGNLAKNIRQLREARNLTQDQLAKASGVPRPTWANLESGTANPTVGVLVKVAGTLQVSVEELISPPRASCRLYKAEALPSRKRGEVTIRRLLPDSIQYLELDRMELAPEARLGGVPHRTGTREYCACEAGELELTVSGERWRLEAGDVLVFRGDQKHSYSNPGSKTAIAYCVILLGNVSE